MTAFVTRCFDHDFPEPEVIYHVRFKDPKGNREYFRIRSIGAEFGTVERRDCRKHISGHGYNPKNVRFVFVAD
jgi:hypothetical protein